jgi:UDP-glucuronate 4-epimerase
MKILVTGSAGFIGAAVCERLLTLGHTVIGIDNLNDYYDVNLKKARLERLLKFNTFIKYTQDLLEGSRVKEIFGEHKPEQVIHLAAQAGVRYSLINPFAYIDSNITGFLNILEASKEIDIKHLIYASSSSVYGANNSQPLSENEVTDSPLSFYAATKKSNEMMAFSYGHLYGLRNTGLRLFTVFGPWGRPDMALFKFTKAILSGEKIDVFNGGNHKRDFTYIDDVVDAVIGLLGQKTEAINLKHSRIYNIGNNQPINLIEFISILEQSLGKSADKNFCEMQPGDVPETWADISKISADFQWSPKISIKDGVERFVSWYLSEYKKI